MGAGRLAVLLVLVGALAGCGGPPADPPPSFPSPSFNDIDVMFLQMSLDYIGQGDQVVVLAELRATDPRVRALAVELRGQWRAEAGTMRRWLAGWERPPSADPAAEAHAGHGDVHSLRPADIAELAATQTDFDRTAVSLLLGHLHNCVAVARMEAAGGLYPPAKELAAELTRSRQGQIRRLLTLAA